MTPLRLSLLMCLCLSLLFAKRPAHAQIEAYQVPESVQTQIDAAIRAGGDDFTQLIKIATAMPHLSPYIAAEVARRRPQAVGRITAAMAAAVPNEAAAIAAALALAVPNAAGVIAQAATAAVPGQASAIRAAIVRVVPTAATDDALRAGGGANLGGNRADVPSGVAAGPSSSSQLMPAVPLRAPGRGYAPQAAASAAATQDAVAQAVTAALSRVNASANAGDPSGRMAAVMAAALGEQIRKNPAVLRDSLVAGMAAAVQLWRTRPPAQRAAFEADVPAALLSRLVQDLAQWSPELAVIQMPDMAFAVSRSIPEITPTLVPAILRGLVALPERLRPALEGALVESIGRLAMVRPDLTATLAQLAVEGMRQQAAMHPDLASVAQRLPAALVRRLLTPQRGQAIVDPAPVAMSLATALADASPERAVEVAVAAVKTAPIQGRNEAGQRTALGEAVVAALAPMHPDAAVEARRQLNPGLLGVFR
jgi:hypothetical protein